MPMTSAPMQHPFARQRSTFAPSAMTSSLMPFDAPPSARMQRALQTAPAYTRAPYGYEDASYPMPLSHTASLYDGNPYQPTAMTRAPYNTQLAATPSTRSRLSSRMNALNMNTTASAYPCAFTSCAGCGKPMPCEQENYDDELDSESDEEF